MRTPLRHRLLLAAALLFAGLVGVGYYLSVVLSDGLSFSRGGLAHAILVRSDTIRTFPMIEPADDAPTYFYSARDGTSPARFELRYFSRATAGRLLAGFDEFCRASGFVPDPQTRLIADASRACDAPDYRIEAVIRPSGPTTAVTAVFLER